MEDMEDMEDMKKQGDSGDRMGAAQEIEVCSADASIKYLEEALLTTDLYTKKVIDLARRLTALNAEIAVARADLQSLNS